MFGELVKEARFKAFKGYEGPVSSTVSKKTYNNAQSFMKSEKALKSTQDFLEHLCCGVEILPEFKFGKVSQGTVRRFHMAYSVVHFPDETFPFDGKSHEDNQELVRKARTMVEAFEEVLAGFEARRTTFLWSFHQAARDYFTFLRGWFPRDIQRMTIKLRQILTALFLNRVPATDTSVRFFREILQVYGGIEALEVQDSIQSRLTSLMRMLNLDGPEVLRAASIHPNGTVVLSVARQAGDGDGEDDEPEEQDPNNDAGALDDDNTKTNAAPAA